MGIKSAARKAKASRKSVDYYGKRVGTKRSDKRWQSPDGELWDSRYEFVVYTKYKQAGYEIQRCDASDTFSFTLPIRQASCGTCGSTEVGQRRSFTPDFRIVPSSGRGKDIRPGYYVEAKGYLRPKERALLRAFCKANPYSNTRFIFQQDYRLTKGTASRPERRITDWFKQFCIGMQYAVWTGEVPIEFQSCQGTAKSNKAVRKRKNSTQRGTV